MNQVELDKTVILKSDLDFTKLKNGASISQQANISGSTRLPKNPDKSPEIRCDLEFSMGKPGDELYIYLKMRCLFKITQLDDREALEQDVATACRSKALRELDDKLATLTKLHTGIAIRIPGLDDEA